MHVYDFDGTIYAGDSTVDFFKFAIRKHPAALRYVPRQAWGFGLYALKRIDKTTLKQYFYSFLRGIPAEALLEAFWQAHREKIYPWYLEQQREDDLVISASPEFLLRPICAQLGIRNLIASRVDSRTGCCTGINCHGQQKVAFFREAYPEGVVEEFYSDSLSDLPMAKLAERAFLIDKGIKKPWNTEQQA